MKFGLTDARDLTSEEIVYRPGCCRLWDGFRGRGTFVVGFEAGEVGFEDGLGCGSGLTGLEGCDAGYFAEEEFGFFLRSAVLLIHK